MTRKEFSTPDIERIILYKLARRGAWGEAYVPLDTVIRQISKKVKNDGKRVRGVVDSLIKRGYLIPHKGGKTISLNPSKKREILEEIEKLLS